MAWYSSEATLKQSTYANIGQRLLIKQALLSHEWKTIFKKQLKKYSFTHDKLHRVVRLEIKRRTPVSQNK